MCAANSPALRDAPFTMTDGCRKKTGITDGQRYGALRECAGEMTGITDGQR